MARPSACVSIGCSVPTSTSPRPFDAASSLAARSIQRLSFEVSVGAVAMMPNVRARPATSAGIRADAATSLSMHLPPVSVGEGSATIRSARPSPRSEEHTSELQSLMRISYAVFCLKKKKKQPVIKKVTDKQIMQLKRFMNRRKRDKKV